MKKIPEFKTVEDIREFWVTHDFSEFAKDTEEAQARFVRPRKAQITFRLEPNEIEKLKIIAQEKGLSYTSLVRMWIKEKFTSQS
ncbi:MAG: hypothetical protein KGZ93_06680 [Actinobacteria bacterium]|nr:hypothetical protein [Actinomycetota bacterium]